jgi:phosphotriesterase-related protein
VPAFTTVGNPAQGKQTSVHRGHLELKEISVQDQMFSVRTASGMRTISAADGYTLPHEHVLIDNRIWWRGEGDRNVLDPEGVDLANMLEEVVRAPEQTARENLVLCDWYVAAKELRLASKTGCQLVVELTSGGLDPHPDLAKRAADLAGIEMVLGVGRYIADSLSDVERQLSVEQLSDQWLRDCALGVSGSKPGIIGEIGTGRTIEEVEKKSLKAAARVQVATGLAINVHLHPYARQGLAALQILEDAGADLSKVALSHCDGVLSGDWLLQLLERGCYVEFDFFGTSPDQAFEESAYPSDIERIAMLSELCERGWGRRLLLSQDICHRDSLVANGGTGYGHLGTTVRPLLEESIGHEMTQQIMAENPLRLLHLGVPPGGEV